MSGRGEQKRDGSECRGSSVDRSGRVLIAAVALAPFLATGAAQVARADNSGTSSTPPPAGTLTFQPTSPVLTFHLNGRATTTVQILNAGNTVPVRFALEVLPRGPTVPASKVVSSCSPVAPGFSTVMLSFRKPFPPHPSSQFGATVSVAAVTVAPKQEAKPGRPGIIAPIKTVKTPTIDLCGDPTIATKTLLPHVAAITVAIRRLTGVMIDLVVPALIGLAAAAAFLAAAVIFQLKRLKRAANDTRLDSFRRAMRDDIEADTTWNFKDNWATNLTAIGAVIGTALTALGSTSTVLPGIQISNFAMLLTLWGVIAVTVPLLLLTVRKRVTKPPATAYITTGTLSGVGDLLTVELRTEPDDEHQVNEANKPGREKTVEAAVTIENAQPPPRENAASGKPEHAATARAGGVSVPFVQFALAGALTILAVTSELATGWVLIRLSSLWALLRYGLTCALLIAGLVILGYAIWNSRALLEKRGADKSLSQ